MIKVKPFVTKPALQKGDLIQDAEARVWKVLRKPVTKGVTPVTKKVTPAVTLPVTRQDWVKVIKPILGAGVSANALLDWANGPGRCPTCGHPVKRHVSPAAKQKAYRKRRKVNA